MSKLSQEERSKKLMVPTLIGGVSGAIPGLLAGPAFATNLSVSAAIFNGVLGGALAGMACALFIVMKVGIENKLHLWWFAIGGFVAGMIGSMLLIFLMGYLQIYLDWALEARKWLYNID